jgi:hypothetical protein
MKSLAIVLALCSACVAHAQGSANPPTVPSDPHQFFHAPPLPQGKPQFKWQRPDASHRYFMFKPPEVTAPAKPLIDSNVDPGILRKPQGFEQRPSRPAPHRDLYPDLKIQPTEIAKLEGFGAWPPLKAEPIPTVFPRAKFEPIPITWDEFRMIPAGAEPPSNP